MKHIKRQVPRLDTLRGLRWWGQGHVAYQIKRIVANNIVIANLLFSYIPSTPGMESKVFLLYEIKENGA